MRRLIKEIALKTVYYSGASRLIARRYGGCGTIFALHKIVHNKTESLAAWLTTRLDFLDDVVAHFRPIADFVTLAEVRERLMGGERDNRQRPFIALTFDDGFRGNLAPTIAMLKRYQVPMTFYVPSGAPDRTVDPWPWRLEKAIQKLTEFRFDFPELPRIVPMRTLGEKRAALATLNRYIHGNIPARRDLPELMLSRARVSDESLITEQFVSWEELRALAADPLATIGGHTITHPSLQDLNEEDAICEISGGRLRLQEELDREIAHFAYPYGADGNCGPREFALAGKAGFLTAVTLTRGNVFHQHRHQLMSLPRFGLGGTKEKISLASADLAGAPTALGSHWRNPVVKA
jgi:peptidoglycan/xylan/chitin deacetylase (PgdA/CDA1 family)